MLPAFLHHQSTFLLIRETNWELVHTTLLVKSSMLTLWMCPKIFTFYSLRCIIFLFDFYSTSKSCLSFLYPKVGTRSSTIRNLSDFYMGKALFQNKCEEYFVASLNKWIQRPLGALLQNVKISTSRWWHFVNRSDSVYVWVCNYHKNERK